MYEYHKDVEYVDEWGILATAKSGDHEDYLNKIPDELKEQVKDYFKNKKKNQEKFVLFLLFQFFKADIIELE